MKSARLQIYLWALGSLLFMPRVGAGIRPVDAVVGKAPGMTFAARNHALRQLPERLDGHQREIIYHFLKNPMAAVSAGTARLMEEASLANDLAEHMIRVEDDLEPMVDLLVQAVIEPEAHIIWKDYSLQFMGSLLEMNTGRGLTPEHHRLIEQTLWQTVNHAKGSLPGTALLSLRRGMAGRGYRDELSAAALAVAANPQQHDASRLTALQVAFSFQHPGVLPLAREHLANRASVPLRLVSLRIVGGMGAADDRPVLDAYLDNPIRPLQQTARTSLDVFLKHNSN